MDIPFFPPLYIVDIVGVCGESARPLHVPRGYSWEIEECVLWVEGKFVGYGVDSIFPL